MKISKILVLAMAVSVVACTKLEPSFRGELGQGTDIPVADLLKSAYNAFNNPMMDQSRFWAAQEHTTDEAIGPTRGGDWDDNGVWRVLHSHGWNAEHGFLRDTYRELLQAQYAAGNVLEFSPSAQQAAEARFLRAFSVFLVLDGWNQVPFREDLKDFKQLPKTMEGSVALDYVISECNAIIATLPDGPVSTANKDAARVLLMKAYLNKCTFANRAQPTFAPADMNQVI